MSHQIHARGRAVAKTTTEPGPERVIVTVSGGLVQDVQGGPEDLVIEIRDYDVNGMPDHELVADALQDEDGICFVANIWDELNIERTRPGGG